MTLDAPSECSRGGKSERIAVIGLGYVGLPLAVAFARQYGSVSGYDASPQRIADLQAGNDRTGEITKVALVTSSLVLSSNPSVLEGATLYFVTVPTPTTLANRPDLSMLLDACATIGPHLRSGSVVVFESTVYPGVTEDICGPALEASSGLKCGADFTLGYSPERANPGDQAHRLESVVKVVAAQDRMTLFRLEAAYRSVVPAGLHLAPSIKVAEAAKVIENIQRDLNIALMNEFALIFDRLGISTRDVLAAAGTKWNFLKFRPGLVGGHCIGVDPYFLTEKATEVGYHPDVILAGRRINDGMGLFVGQKVVRLLSAEGILNTHTRVAILGLTFKQDVPDMRNSRVPDIVTELRCLGISPIVHDPNADLEEVQAAVGIPPCRSEDLSDLDAVVLATPHREYIEDPVGILRMLRSRSVLVDVCSALNPALVPDGVRYWSL
jgi:UDP-N-acetyl-D-galactosamine dehydrogenase